MKMNVQRQGSFLSTGVIVLLSAIAICILPLALAWYFQERLIFIPEVDSLLGPVQPELSTPEQWHLPHEDIFTVADNGEKNHAWIMKQPDSTNRPTIVFFHGNAGTVTRRLPFYSLLYHSLKVNVVASSYRGYGLSSGSPGENEFNEDSEKLIKALSQRVDIDKSKLIVFGRSIGGAVAINAAVKCPEVRAVVVENTFWSLRDVATEVYRPLAYVGFLDMLLRHKFNSGSKIDQVKQPVMFISGDSDELVPPSHMRKLYSTAQSAKGRAWVLVGNGTHNDTWLVHQREYVKALKRFLDAIDEEFENCDFEVEIGSPKKGAEAQKEHLQSSFVERVSTIFRAEPASAASMEKKDL